MKNKVDEFMMTSYKIEAGKYAEKIVDTINDLDMDDEITLMVMSMVMTNVVGQIMPRKEHINEYYKDLAEETHKAFEYYKE